MIIIILSNNNDNNFRRLYMIDLAGSERAANTQVEFMSQKNKSEHTSRIYQYLWIDIERINDVKKQNTNKSKHLGYWAPIETILLCIESSSSLRQIIGIWCSECSEWQLSVQGSVKFTLTVQFPKKKNSVYIEDH